MCPLFTVRLPGPFALCAAVPFPPARDSLEPALSATIPVHSLSCSDVDAEYTAAEANCQFSRQLGVHPNRSGESLDISARNFNPLCLTVTFPECERRAFSQHYLYGCHMLLALQRAGAKGKRFQQKCTDVEDGLEAIRGLPDSRAFLLPTVWGWFYGVALRGCESSTRARSGG